MWWVEFAIFKRFATNSNSYAWTHQKADKTFVGYAWNNIITEEMIRFNGMVLKMSIDDRKLGGYEAYFKEEIPVSLGEGYTVTLNDYPAWASKIMPLWRFKQIYERHFTQRLELQLSATSVTS